VKGKKGKREKGGGESADSIKSFLRSNPSSINSQYREEEGRKGKKVGTGHPHLNPAPHVCIKRGGKKKGEEGGAESATPASN